LKIIREIGVHRIREKSKKMTARLIELAAQRGWKVNSPSDPERRAGTVTIDMPNSTSEAVCKELLRRDVLVDFRPKAGVRFSPHFYNTMEEIDRAIETVDEILSDMRVTASVG
jgi:kynureninase